MEKIKRVRINDKLRYAVCIENEIKFLLNDQDMLEIWDRAITEDFEIDE